MIGNVVDNAVKYSDEDKEILIEIRKEDEFLNLKISNYGDEISSVEIQKIFNNFYRVNRAGGIDSKGCGLGLAIVKKIIELHSGSVLFSSDSGLNSISLKILTGEI